MILKLFIDTYLKSKRFTEHQYKREFLILTVMYIQKLHHFCNTSPLDDWLRLGGKYLGNN